MPQVPDEDLLADLRTTAERLRQPTIGMKAYRDNGKYADTAISRRFGTWNMALQKAGLPLLNELHYSDERLFANILTLWEHYGHQPRRKHLAEAPSAISQSPYNRRFGSWTAALMAFINFVNSADAVVPEKHGGDTRRATGRDPSLRLRWNVLKRDQFKCVKCGASPATGGPDLQVDHVVPWSRGGETVAENLQTLCLSCNLGKSNVG